MQMLENNRQLFKKGNRMESIIPSQNEAHIMPFHNAKTISKFKVSAQKLFFLACITS